MSSPSSVWQNLIANAGEGRFQAQQLNQSQQRVDIEKRQQAQQEADDLRKNQQQDYEWAQHHLQIGSKPIHNGMVREDVPAPNYSTDDSGQPTSPSGIQGNMSGATVPIYRPVSTDNGRFIAKRKTAEGPVQEFEVQGPDEQMALHASRAQKQFAADAPLRQQQDQEASSKAQAVAAGTAQGTVGGHQAGLEAERNRRGVDVPSEIVNRFPGMAGEKVLPEELPGLAQSATSMDELPAASAARRQKIIAGSAQALSAVNDQPSYDQFLQQNPDAAAHMPKIYSAPVVDSFIRQAVPIEKQPAYDIKKSEALSLKQMVAMTPTQWQQRVERVTGPSQKPNDLADRTTGMVQAAVSRGDYKTAEKYVDNASEQMGKTETAVATAKATAPIRIELAAAAQAAKDKASGVTEDDYQRAGQEYALTGVMPPLGMGSGGRMKVLHYKEQFARDSGLSPRDLAVAGAAFKGDSASLANFQKQRDQIVSFEQTAQKNLDMFMDLASKIPDSGVPWLNTPLRTLDEKAVGSANMAAVNAARQVANNEVAKVTSGGGLSGVLSDTARKEVDKYDPQNATFAQTKAIVNVLRKDMANRHQSMDATIGEIRGRIGNPGGGGVGAVPDAVKAVLSPASVKPGIHTLSDGSKWMKNADGTIAKQ